MNNRPLLGLTYTITRIISIPVVVCKIIGKSECYADMSFISIYGFANWTVNYAPNWRFIGTGIHVDGLSGKNILSFGIYDYGNLTVA